MMTEKELLQYFEDFLHIEFNCNYYYQVIEYRKSINNYFEIGMKNIEEIIYDEEGELIDDSHEYDILIERFIDYLKSFDKLEKYYKNNDYFTEQVYNIIMDHIIIYAY